MTSTAPTRRRVKPYRCGYACDHLVNPADPQPLATVSYGGGVQSTAMLVLAAQGRLPFRTFLFCNVGDDSEHPDTLKYVEHIARPYAAHHGIDLQTLERVRRDGTTETLYGRLMREGSRSLPIPVRMSNGAPGNRLCTADFKIKIVARWLKAHGATADNPATVGIGISLDEIQRAASRKTEAHENVTYPLVGIGIDTGLKMRRDDCMTAIRQEPLPASVHDHLATLERDALPASTWQQLAASPGTMPVPPKSSCYFCPFHRPTAWQELERETPELFAKACALEDTLNERRRMLGKDEVFLTRFAIPLRDAIDTDQPVLFDDTDASCDSGYCWT